MKNYWIDRVELRGCTSLELVKRGFESAFDSVEYIEPGATAIAWTSNSKKVHEFNAFYDIGKELGLQMRKQQGANITLYDLILRRQPDTAFYVLAFVPVEED